MPEDLSAGDEEQRRDGAKLERKTVEALTEWGYWAERREPLLTTEVDVAARRQQPRDEPTDFLVVECKNWATRSIDPPVIFRLVMQAYIGNAMPVLVHTTQLTDRAWKLAQIYDIRLLTYGELLNRGDVPPLTEMRPPRVESPHRRSLYAEGLRNRVSPVLNRRSTERDVEGSVLGGPHAPCYVSDRSGHGDYERII